MPPTKRRHQHQSRRQSILQRQHQWIQERQRPHQWWMIGKMDATRAQALWQNDSHVFLLMKVSFVTCLIAKLIASSDSGNIVWFLFI
jgi:hypothetical protein